MRALVGRASGQHVVGIRTWLWRPKNLALIGGSVAALGLFVGSTGVTVAAAMPFFLSILPCAAMCALGLCMNRRSGGSCERRGTTREPWPSDPSALIASTSEMPSQASATAKSARSLLALALILFVLVGGTALAQAPSGPSTPVPAEAPDAFGAKVRAYLLQHPEVIMEAVQILQQRQQEAAADAAKGVIASRAAEIFRDPTAPVGGNPDGDVTLVEFFDYNCPYCRQVAPILVELRRADPRLRLVYKEFPILGPGSEAAAKAALAAERQGKYELLHDTLMQMGGKVAEAAVFQAAMAVGLNLEQLKRDMADPVFEEAIARNRALAAELGINGTPGFVIANRVIPGLAEKATLEGLIAEARSKGSSQ